MSILSQQYQHAILNIKHKCVNNMKEDNNVNMVEDAILRMDRKNWDIEIKFMYSKLKGLVIKKYSVEKSIFDSNTKIYVLVNFN